MPQFGCQYRVLKNDDWTGSPKTLHTSWPQWLPKGSSNGQRSWRLGFTWGSSTRHSVYQHAWSQRGSPSHVNRIQPTSGGLPEWGHMPVGPNLVPRGKSTAIHVRFRIPEGSLRGCVSALKAVVQLHETFNGPSCGGWPRHHRRHPVTGRTEDRKFYNSWGYNSGGLEGLRGSSAVLLHPCQGRRNRFVAEIEYHPSGYHIPGTQAWGSRSHALSGTVRFGMVDLAPEGRPW